MGRVFVAGSINMDIVAGAASHPVSGETVKGTSLAYYPGGKGANQAVAAAQLGADTHMVGCLGDDASADELREFLSSKKINLDAVTTVPDTPSGTALIVVAGGDNTIVVVPGANDSLSEKLVNGVSVAKGDVILAEFETPQETTKAFFERARDAGATTILNPAPAAPFIDGLLEVCDLVVVNETELASIAGLSTPPKADDHEALSAAVIKARAFDGQIWIVTLGSNGAVAFDKNAEPIVQPGHKVKAVDSTGAGDCFVGVIAASLAEGKSLEESLTRANASAAISVQKHGAGPSMPTAQLVDEFLAG